MKPAPSHANEPSPRELALAALMIAVTPLFWAGHSVVGRLVATEIPTFTLVCLRWLCCFAIFICFVHKRVWSERWLLVKHWRYVLGTALIGPVLFPILLYSGLKTTTVTNTSIIQTLVPSLVPVLAWLMLRETVRPLQIVGVLISMIGVVVIITKGDPMALASVDFVIGDLIILTGFVAWAIYTVTIRLKPAAMHPNTLLASSMLIAGVVTIPLWIFEAMNGQNIPMTPKAFWAIGYIILFPTLLAYYFYSHAINIVGPTKAGLASHLVPPMGIILGVIFLDELFSLYHAVSFAAIITGVLVVIRSGHVSKNPAPT